MELVKNRNGNLVSETHRVCQNCGCVYEKTNRMTICKECNTTRVKFTAPEYRMHQRAKVRSQKLGREFNLEVSDIVIPEHCPILGMKLIAHKGKSGAYDDSPSLDRILNAEGYVVGNIQVISQLANAMKANASVDQLRLFAKWVTSTFGGEGEYKPPTLIRKEIPKKTRHIYNTDEVLQYSRKEAGDKFGISKGHYQNLKKEFLERSSFVEVDDQTVSSQELACTGGTCSI